MPLWLYHHSAYGYIVRASSVEEAADLLALLVSPTNPVHPSSRQALLLGLELLVPEGPSEVVAEWPG